MTVEWRVKATEFANCNCVYACPCQFNALPTNGNCHAAGAWQIEEGHFGAVRLDGLRLVGLYNFPGPVHEGNGTMQVIIDERANAEQRDALLKIVTGQETDDMATMWWVYSAMAPHKLEPQYRPIEFEVDTQAPKVAITQGPEARSNHTSATFEGTASEEGEVVVHILENGKQISTAGGQVHAGAWSATPPAP